MVLRGGEGRAVMEEVEGVEEGELGRGGTWKR
jgi:hypothetical protein